MVIHLQEARVVLKNGELSLYNDSVAIFKSSIKLPKLLSFHIIVELWSKEFSLWSRGIGVLAKSIMVALGVAFHDHQNISKLDISVVRSVGSMCSIHPGYSSICAEPYFETFAIVMVVTPFTPGWRGDLHSCLILLVNCFKRQWFYFNFDIDRHLTVALIFYQIIVWFCLSNIPVACRLSVELEPICLLLKGRVEDIDFLIGVLHMLVPIIQR